MGCCGREKKFTAISSKSTVIALVCSIIIVLSVALGVGLGVGLQNSSSGGDAADVSYPLGTCQFCQATLACPQQECPPAGNCGRLYYPSLTGNININAKENTQCLSNFPSTCDLQPKCPSCSLWQVLTRKCTVAMGCSLRGDYAVIRGLDKHATRNDTLCFDRNHYFIVPTRPCTGIESTDTLCTGPEGEKYWVAAYSFATEELGFEISMAQGSPKTWGMMINAVNWRSQHQLHIRVGSFLTTVNEVVPMFLQVKTFSTSLDDPTVTTAGDFSVWASVFISAESAAELETVVRPYYTAARIQAVEQKGISYGILVVPHAQVVDDEEKIGFVVTRTIYTRGGDVLDESVGDDCRGPCDTWEGAA